MTDAEPFHRWTPISRLQDRELTANAGLDQVRNEWNVRQNEMKQAGTWDRFLARLRRRWSIETGVIEGVYAVDRGQTVTLIEHGFSQEVLRSGGMGREEAARTDSILHDQAEVFDALLDFVGGARPLSTSFIKELHVLLCRNQDSVDVIDTLGHMSTRPLLKGAWKEQNNNPRREDGRIHEYAPTEHVPAEMERLVDWFLEYEEQGIAAEVLASWVHHRFAQVHPFMDGNGRVARSLATLVLIRGGLFPFIVDRGNKDRYIDALEMADRGDLVPFIQLLSRWQVREISKAMEGDRVDAATPDLVATGLSRVKASRARQAAAFEDVRPLGDALMARVRARIQRFADAFLDQARSEGLVDIVGIDVSNADQGTAHYHRGGLIETARGHDYYANFDAYSDWTRVRIFRRDDDSATELVVSTHGVGFMFRGILALSALTQVRDPELADEIGQVRRQPVKSATAEPFEFGYLQSEEYLGSQVDAWIDDALDVFVGRWAQTQ